MFTDARAVRVVPLGVLLLLGLAGAGRGEEKQLGNKLEYEAEFNRTYPQRHKLINGERNPQGPEDQRIIDVAARWYFHRVTWIPNKNDSKEMAKLHQELEEEFVNRILGSKGGKGKELLIEQLGKPTAKYLNEVLGLDFVDNRLAVINAAVMLPVVARLKQEEVGDLLVKLLKDEARHDSVKFYAAKALREFFPAQTLTVLDFPMKKERKLKFDRDMARVQALTDYIAKGAPARETDPDVVGFLRREAISSLAQVGVPALSGLKKDGEVKGAAAYELLRILVRGKEALTPPTSLPERIEAALGLCYLKDPQDDTGYDPSMAAFAVGICFLEFATEYSQDHPNIVGRKNPKNISKDSRIPTHLWRIHAERFSQAAKELAANMAKGAPKSAHASAQRLEAAIPRIADAIKAYNPVEDTTLRDFRAMVKAMAPKSGQLYRLKGPQLDASSLVPDLAAEAAEAPAPRTAPAKAAKADGK